MRPRIDPRLESLLASASDGDVVEAIVKLHKTPRSWDPKEIGGLVDEMMQATAKEAGASPGKVVVFRHMRSFSLSAKKAFLERLFDRPEVEAVAANSQDAGSITTAAIKPEQE